MLTNIIFRQSMYVFRPDDYLLFASMTVELVVWNGEKSVAYDAINFLVTVQRISCDSAVCFFNAVIVLTCPLSDKYMNLLKYVVVETDYRNYLDFMFVQHISGV